MPREINLVIFIYISMPLRGHMDLSQIAVHTFSVERSERKKEA